MSTSLRTLSKPYREWRRHPRLGMLTGLAGLAALATILWACLPVYDYYSDPYYYYVPSYADFTFGYYNTLGVWYPYSHKGGAEEGGTEGGGTGGTRVDAITAPPQAGIGDLREERLRLDTLNVYVRHVLMPVDVLVKKKPSSQMDSQRVYGPLDYPEDKPTATFRLTGKKLADDKYGWRLDAKPLEADDSQYKPVMAGYLEKAIEARRGTGILGFHLDNLHAVNPAAYPGTGKLVASNATAPQQAKALLVRLIDFKPTAEATPATGVWAGDCNAAGNTHARTVSYANRVKADPDLGNEKVVDYLSWVHNTGGRLYEFISEGDIPKDAFWLGQACYDKGGTLIYKGWHYCEGTAPPACLSTMATGVETPSKTPADCPAGTEVAPPDQSDPGNGPTPTAPALPPPVPETPPSDIPAS